MLCFLCGISDDSVKRFKTENLKKCVQSSASRIHFNLKYENCKVPTEINDNVGYHSSCYSTFNALKPQHRLTKLSNTPNNPAPIPPSRDETQQNEGNETEQYQVGESEGAQYQGDEAEENGPKGAQNPVDRAQQNDDDEENQVEHVCVICQRARKKYKGRYQVCHETQAYDTMDKVLSYAFKWDIDTATRIQSCKQEDRPMHYHAICKVNYFNNIKKQVRTNVKGSWHKTRKMYQSAFSAVCEYIKENVIEKGDAVSEKLIRKLFEESLVAQYHSDNSNKLIPHSRHITKRVKVYFKKDIKFVTHKRFKVCVRRGTNVSFNEDELNEKELLTKAALILRRYLRNCSIKKLSQNINVADLLQGECELPQNVLDFFILLIGGVRKQTRVSQKTIRLSKSLASDLVFAVTRGKVLPKKHIVLGSAVKSLSNSHRCLKMLNRYGHTASYDTIVGLETETTYSASERSTVCPPEIVLKSGLSTNASFDNFDRFTESDQGRITLNDTVGIVFQDIVDEEDSSVSNQDNCTVHNEDSTHNSEYDSVSNQDSLLQNESESSAETDTANTRRRKSFKAILPDLRPYYKKPRIEETLLPYDSPLRLVVPQNLDEIKKIDLSWLLSHICRKETPMWVGFNAKIIPDTTKRQRIAYLPPINKSPTDKSVVLETMQTALKIADECGQEYAQVTYDLGIAKIAFPLKSTEHEEMRKLFIHLGAFHIEMAYFKAIGSFIDGSGLTTVMVESELIGGGSVNAFLAGKHFNKCKRLHVLVTLALQMQQFDFFLKTKSIILEESVEQFFTKTTEIPLIIENEEVLNIMNQYGEFEEEVLEGRHGKTPQYHAMYIRWVYYYLLFERGIRTADLRLFTYAMQKMNSLFFTFNHINYAKWLVWYENALLAVDRTHPGLKDDFLKGSFSLKTTAKPFSRKPIDLTLEQTMNADAGRKYNGFTFLANSIDARQRWSINHGIRCTLIRAALEDCSLSSKQETTNDLRPHKIRKARAQLECFISNLNSRMNPFSTDLRKECLFQIATGQSAPQEIEDFLLKVEQDGEKKRKELIESCSENIDSFQNYVFKKNKILNFASFSKKTKKSTVKGKLREVKVQRNMFARVLGIVSSTKQAVDMDKVVSYPISDCPPSFCHAEGPIHKTDKSALAKILVRSVEDHGQPDQQDVLIIDGFFFLHLLADIPQKFGDVSMKILRILTKAEASKIFIVFDKYNSPSIKDNEHVFRDNFFQDFCITGPDQNRPVDFKKELKNVAFKEALVSFIIDDWCSEKTKTLIGNKKIYVSYKKCYLYRVTNDAVSCQIVRDLECQGHEEADTKIIFLLSKLEAPCKVVFQCSDTDILVITLGNMAHFSKDIQVWLLFGTGNNRQFVNVRRIYEELGNELCAALPAFHALTGCDFNPSFFRIGKTRPWKTFANNDEFINAFTNLSCPENDDYEVILKSIEKFICQVYSTKKNGLQHCEFVDEARKRLFQQNYFVSNKNESFAKDFSNFDPCVLPPCQRELRQQLLRTTYISNVWSNATKPIPTSLDPTNYGWILTANGYTFHWFEGDQFPKDVAAILEKEDGNPEADNVNYDSEEDSHDDEFSGLIDYSDDETDDDTEDESDDEIRHEDITDDEEDEEATVSENEDD